MPRRGIGPSPPMKTGFSPLSSTTLSPMNQSGVRLSPSTPQAHHQQHHEERGRHGQEDHPQIGLGQRHGRARRRQQMEQRRRQQPARRSRHHRERQEQADRGADHPARRVEIAPAHALADQDGGRHAEAEHRRGQQEHDDVGVRGRRQRAFAQIVADPDGVDRAVQRLQHAGGERRQREGDQCRPDRPGGQVAPSCARGLGHARFPPARLRTAQPYTLKPPRGQRRRPGALRRGGAGGGRTRPSTAPAHPWWRSRTGGPTSR